MNTQFIELVKTVLRTWSLNAIQPTSEELLSFDCHIPDNTDVKTRIDIEYQHLIDVLTFYHKQAFAKSHKLTEESVPNEIPWFMVENRYLYYCCN